MVVSSLEPDSLTSGTIKATPSFQLMLRMHSIPSDTPTPTLSCSIKLHPLLASFGGNTEPPPSCETISVQLSPTLALELVRATHYRPSSLRQDFSRYSIGSLIPSAHSRQLITSPILTLLLPDLASFLPTRMILL